MDGPGTVRARVTRFRHKNSDTGFVIAMVRNLDALDQAEVSVKGTMDIDIGCMYEFEGRWETHPKYGPGMIVRSYRSVAPTTSDGIEAYLSNSDLFPNIGPARAAQLVDKFGDKTLEVIEKEPARLREVSGLTEERVAAIVACYVANRDKHKLFTDLYAHGLTPFQVSKLFAKYGSRAVEVLQNDPYAVTEIDGFGFTTADNLAMRFGMSKTSEKRALAAVCYLLDQLSSEGHTRVTAAMLTAKAGELQLQIPDERLGKAVHSLVTDPGLAYKGVGFSGDSLHLVQLYNCELTVAAKLKSLYTTPLDRGLDFDFAPFGLNEKQREIVKASQLSRVLVVTGGPGTGKSHTLAALRSSWLYHRLRVGYAAPTGKAAQRMAEMMGHQEQTFTIHRLLGFNPVMGWEYDELNQLPYDVVVVDEVSMLDIELAAALLRAIDHEHTQLVLIGDVDQLPSVGPGAVLKDVIESSKVPVVRLTEIMRQEATSKIVTAAHAINRGESFEFDNKVDDLRVYFFPDEASQESIAAGVVGMITNKLREEGWDAVNDVQVLTPMRSHGALAADNLGVILQKTFNPAVEGRPELKLWGKGEEATLVRLGDKVIQTKNDYELGVFNGEIGTVVDIGPVPGGKGNAQQMRVDYAGGRPPVVYAKADKWAHLRLAYALTIHKAQGSEFPVVIVPLHRAQYRLLNRQLLYTAVTRARKLCIILCTRKAISQAITCNDQAQRLTRLKAMLVT